MQHDRLSDSLLTETQANFILTRAGAEMALDRFASDKTRDEIMSWASEEKGIGCYVGRCRVLDLREGDYLIRPHDLAPHLFGKVTHVLIRTQGASKRGRVLTPEAIELMASCGVKLLGMDLPMLDAPGCSSKRCYKTAQKYGIAVMLDLNLDTVSSGDYHLMALPNKSKSESADLKAKQERSSSTTRAA